MFEFLGADINSHMPFVARGPDGPACFFCLKPDGYWKVYCCLDGTSVKRVETGLPADATECSPYAEFHNGEWEISWIAGGAAGARRYKLWFMRGLEGTPMEVGNAGYGLVSKERIVCGGHDHQFEVRRNHMPTLSYALKGVEYLYRITASADDPHLLILSGTLDGGAVFTWLLHLLRGNLRKLTLDGGDAYKACCFRDRWYYAQRLGTFEDRRIIESKHVDVEELDTADIVTVNGLPFQSYAPRETVTSLIASLPCNLW